MADDNFTISQVERELINAFRRMPAQASGTLLRVAQHYAKESAERNTSGIRLAASAGQLLAR